MRITFKREPRATGLARVCQGERGYEVKVDGVRVGRVYPCYESGRFSPKLGYYYTARGVDIPHRNTSHSPVLTVEQAKADCKAYILSCLKPGAQ